MLNHLRRIHKNQKGFTLIEVLVVMTILGILAAIVSISMLGVTSNARAKAKAEELQTVQAAFDAMLADQQVPATLLASYCNGAATETNDMTNFPGPGSLAGAPQNIYTAPGLGIPTVLATHYLRQTSTQYHYGCSTSGDVLQSTER